MNYHEFTLSLIHIFVKRNVLFFDFPTHNLKTPQKTLGRFKFLNHKNLTHSSRTLRCLLYTSVVERDGHITDVKVVRSVDPSLDKEAARVVRSMPAWIPGKQNGSAVRVKYNVPVSFKLQ